MLTDLRSKFHERKTRERVLSRQNSASAADAEGADGADRYQETDARSSVGLGGAGISGTRPMMGLSSLFI